MPVQRRGEAGEGSRSTVNRRRRRRGMAPKGYYYTAVAAAASITPSPPREEEEEEEEEEHASQQQEIEENRTLDAEIEESGTDPEEFDEVVAVSLSELRSNVQCPICLGIIKKTRTVMGCLHRFCRECIDKSMRLGNNECPACRIHCASRRSLRDDLDFDSFISSVYPDPEKYEEEESVIHEEEKTRNEQIQASISRTYQRQLEALGKVGKFGRDTDSPSTSRTPRSCRNSYSRRRNFQKNGVDDSNKNQNDKDTNAVNDEYQPEISQRRRGRRKGIPTARSPSVAMDVEEVVNVQSGAETPNEDKRSYSGPVNPDLLTWGRGGVRSNNRHGAMNSNKVTRINRIQKLTEHLSNLKHEHEHAPVITTHMHGDEMLWLKDHRTSSSNLSSSMPVLQSPPQAIKALAQEFNSITIPHWMKAILEKTAS